MSLPPNQILTPYDALGEKQSLRASICTDQAPENITSPAWAPALLCVARRTAASHVLLLLFPLPGVPGAVTRIHTSAGDSASSVMLPSVLTACKASKPSHRSDASTRDAYSWRLPRRTSPQPWIALLPPVVPRSHTACSNMVDSIIVSVATPIMPVDSRVELAPAISTTGSHGAMETVTLDGSVAENEALAKIASVSGSCSSG